MSRAVQVPRGWVWLLAAVGCVGFWVGVGALIRAAGGW